VTLLLDTNVIGEIRKRRPHPAVTAWYATVSEDQLFLSVLVVGEIHQGVERLRRRDPRQAAVYETWLVRLRRDYGDRILPVTQDVALEWGRLNADRPLPVVDGLLAATARVHGMTLVTRNVADFARSAVKLLNPFEA